MSEEIVDAVDTELVETPIEGEEALGDPGKKALDLMKQQRKAAQDEAKALKAERDALKAQIDGREAEHAAEQEKQRAKDDALAAANKRILSAELRGAAKGKLADPSDAALYINLDEFEVSDDGDVDSDSLREAIDDLLARKPHLAADTRLFSGAADQGAKGISGPSQLRETDLESMTHAEINQARREGRLNRILGIKS
jgi:hypothetical protein